MFWNRSLDWLLEHCPTDEKLLFLYGRNAYLKTRNAEGDRAFNCIRSSYLRKKIAKVGYKSRAAFKNLAKAIYLKIKT